MGTGLGYICLMFFEWQSSPGIDSKKTALKLKQKLHRNKFMQISLVSIGSIISGDGSVITFLDLSI